MIVKYEINVKSCMSIFRAKAIQVKLVLLYMRMCATDEINCWTVNNGPVLIWVIQTGTASALNS